MDRRVRRVFLIQLISMGAMEMSNPFWPLHLQTLADSGDLVAMGSIGVYLLPMLGIMLTASLWGRMGDRLGHKWMMIRALAGLAVTQLLLAWSSDVYVILGLRFLQGALAGFIAPAQAYCAAVTDTKRQYRMFAMMQVSTNIGSVAGAVMGGLMLDQASLPRINLVAGLLCAGCALLVWQCLPAGMAGSATGGKPDVQEHACPPHAWTALRRWLPGMLMALGLLAGARMILQAPFSVYADQVLGMDAWTIGLSYGLVALGFCVFADMAARWFEKRADGEIWLAQRFVTLGLLLTAVFLAGVRSGLAFGIGQFLLGALISASTPVITALIARNAGAQKRGFVLGLAQSVSQGFAIGGIVLGGLLIGHESLVFLYFYVAAAYALALLVVWYQRGLAVARYAQGDGMSGTDRRA